MDAENSNLKLNGQSYRITLILPSLALQEINLDGKEEAIEAADRLRFSLSEVNVSVVLDEVKHFIELDADGEFKKDWSEAMQVNF